MTQILPSRSITHDQSSVFFISPNGEVQMSPDNRIKDPAKVGRRGWHMVEAKTARDKEYYSAKMAEQLWRRKTAMEVERLMREQETRNMLRNSAKIRQAKSPSKLDYDLNQRVLDKIEADEDKFYRLLCEQFDSSKRTSGLEEEFREEAIGFYASRGDKQAGING